MIPLSWAPVGKAWCTVSEASLRVATEVERKLALGVDLLLEISETSATSDLVWVLKVAEFCVVRRSRFKLFGSGASSIL